MPVVDAALESRDLNKEEKEALADQCQVILANTIPEDYHEILNILGFRRPWRPKHTGWINVLDQFLHALYAAVIFLPVFIWPSYWTAALSGLLMGSLREWEQYKNWDWHILMFWDRLQDASFFAVGAVILYHFIH